MLRLALCRFFALPRGKILPLKRQELIHLSSFPTLEWSSELCYFCKASNLSELRLEAFGTFLSQTLITYSHNSQPVDSHQQTVPRVTYSPFSPFLLHLLLYSSTASFLVQIDRPVTPSRNLSEEELGLWRGGGRRCKHFLTGSLQESFATEILACLWCYTSRLPKRENVLWEIISEVMCNKCSHDLCGVNAIISNLLWLGHSC